MEFVEQNILIKIGIDLKNQSSSFLNSKVEN